MRFYLNVILLFALSNVFSQEIPNFSALDSLYREDQFYIGITYGSLQKRPAGISQNKFTPSFSMGFLRDMPVNKSRTFSIAVGFGYAINSFNQNILITEKEGITKYDMLGANVDYSKNKLSLHYLELPIEIRWRTSTPESHIFWRIYTGFKLNYLVYDRSKYKDSQKTIITRNNKDLNNFQFGPYIAIGRNTWNFYTHYGLSPIFKSGELNNNKIMMNTLAMGLHFYIL